MGQNSLQRSFIRTPRFGVEEREQIDKVKNRLESPLFGRGRSLLDQPANLSFGVAKRLLSIGQSIVDKRDRSCGLGAELEFINISGEILCSRLGKAQGMRGGIQSEEKIITIHQEFT
jgi:hypothetical protein